MESRLFHALTGCDTLSGFVRDGKNQNCMSVQNLLLVLTDALIPETSMQTTERLYSGGSRLMVNHIGPHFQKHPRPAMNWYLIAARVL